MFDIDVLQATACIEALLFCAIAMKVELARKVAKERKPLRKTSWTNKNI